MRNNKKIGAIDLSKEVGTMIFRLGQDVNEVVYESMKSVAAMAVEELKAVSRFSPNGNPTGEYSADWDQTTKTTSRLARKIIVYNEDHYRLTHLLEKGHALRRGGRKIGSVKAYPHIKPVEERVQDEFRKDIANRLADIKSGAVWNY